MLDEHVDLLERAEVEQQLQPLARRQLAALVLGGDAPCPATELRRRALGVEPLQNLPHRSPSARLARQSRARAHITRQRPRQTRSPSSRAARKLLWATCQDRPHLLALRPIGS
jgi:hypothetical protein